MQAVQFQFSYLRYALGLALGRWFPALLWSGLATTGSREVAPPELPGPDWVRIRTRLGGVCGTDLSHIYLHTSTYYLPFSSFPFTFGHENVGYIAELGADIDGWEQGQRVVVEPTLWCEPRGIPREVWCEYCQAGQINRCQNITKGKLATGVMIGTTKGAGGSWSENFVAHQSQLLKVPDGLSDENALMLEPFACGLHAVLADYPEDEETILILGAGTMGLLVVAALRALGSKARILISARYDFQEDAARKLGADEVLRGADLFTEAAEYTGAALYKPMIGKRVVAGGADRVYECTGSDDSIDDALRLTKSGGTVVVMGVPGQAKGIDWTAIFAQELKLIAVDRYSHADEYQGKRVRTFELGLDLLASGKVDLGWMVSRTYDVKDYRKLLNHLRDKREHPIIKAAFAFPPEA